jgi:hypothetical protein
MLHTGGPAFPVGNYYGSTLRDYFAAKAMQGLVSDPDLVLDAIQTAQLSYKYADAMLEARNKE